MQLLQRHPSRRLLHDHPDEIQGTRVDRLDPPNVERDSAWRPLDPEGDAVEVPEPGVDYGVTYPDDPTELYYWR